MADELRVILFHHDMTCRENFPGGERNDIGSRYMCIFGPDILSTASQRGQMMLLYMISPLLMLYPVASISSTAMPLSRSVAKEAL